MASTQVVETSVTSNSPSQDSCHPDDLFESRYTIIMSVKKRMHHWHSQKYICLLFHLDIKIIHLIHSTSDLNSHWFYHEFLIISFSADPYMFLCCCALESQDLCWIFLQETWRNMKIGYSQNDDNITQVIRLNNHDVNRTSSLKLLGWQ